ncbi:MAG: hypothetical protein Harvfovirus16_14 [Harvfovirus sp.]|uniref:Uncharacterized protein n=1 Tax=Harvfovirus sp. TaxID=2487768 RepID=A0A3G5A5L3_9VIRU|nr:MAG: hypothetical protein Harvfovirus16_14 [Harvfovirus sp.]
MPKANNEALDDLITDRGSSPDCQKKSKNKKCNCKEPKPLSRNCCAGNECCGNVGCVVAACNACDVVCLNNALNLIVTTRNFIQLNPIGTTTITPDFPLSTTLNYYVSLPSLCCPSGPCSILWSMGNVVLNNYQGANIASVESLGVPSVTLTNYLNIGVDGPVFDPAKTPAAVNNGFGTFGFCACGDGAVTYKVVVMFGGLSGATGSFIVYNSANLPILDPAGFSFIITGTTIQITSLSTHAIVTPAIFATFYQSANNSKQGCASYWALVEQPQFWA